MENLKIKILKHYHSAKPENIRYGITWYERAHNECLLLSQVFELPLSKVVGVVAALSPNNKWTQNLTDAWNFLDAPSMETKVCTFFNQRKKALAILASDGSDNSIMVILNGLKTRNFYENILHHSKSNRVTVDIWAFRSVDLANSVKNFKATERAYLEVSQELKLRPHQLQAIVWGVVRGKAS